MKKQQAAAPLEDTFLLHSCPESDQKLFMDFDGYDWPGWTYCGPWAKMYD
jgi:hypothetical protein